jgi:ribonuclease D
MAHARITHARSALADLAQQLKMPTENLLSPEMLRQLMWKNPPLDAGANQDFFHQYIGATLRELGAREWQIDQSWECLCAPLIATEPLISEIADETKEEVPTSD